MRARRWWMLGVTCLSEVVVALDLTILNIALPSISAELHAGTRELQCSRDAYALAFAASVLPAGLAWDAVVAGGGRVLPQAACAAGSGGVAGGVGVVCAIGIGGGADRGAGGDGAGRGDRASAVGGGGLGAFQRHRASQGDRHPHGGGRG